MRITFFTLIMALFTASLCHAQKQTKTDTVFFEDFKGPTLDRSKWNVEVTGQTNNNEQQAYVDSSSVMYFAHGKEAEGAKNALVIKAIYHAGYTSKEGNKYDFLSARINTEKKMEFTYGTASCRMKIASGAGMWPAFWALGEGNWPDCGEIDMMETVGDSSWISNALHGPHYFGNTPLAYRYALPNKGNVDQWHIYSVDWTPDKLVFK